MDTTEHADGLLDVDFRAVMKLWREHGGGQHGPHVETVTMPLERFYGFVLALTAAAANARADELQRDRAALSDKLNGTPCAEIRWQQERETMTARIADLERTLERIAELTPGRANAATAHDLHLTINAIAISALRDAHCADDIRAARASCEGRG